MEARIADLVDRMSIKEKISQLTTKSPPIKRLGIPDFCWGGEALHGLINSGRATIFPMPIGVAATFDPDLVKRMAEATADEARAKHHDPAWRGPDGPRFGLHFWSPVINIFRDPRWGRGQETYGEDPFLTGTLGAAFVKGLQGDHPKYLKASACAKHLGVHSGPEPLRQKFNAIVSRKDLYETYLPAFQDLINAGARCIMATYNRVNGEHCCASPTLIGEACRGRFGFTGFVTSDGGALGSIHGSHGITKNAVETAELAMSNGCDLEIGTHAYPLIPEAIKQGRLTEEDVDRALARILQIRFALGEFDDPAEVPYSRIRRNVIQCEKHIALSRDLATKSMVLLKNNGVLPLTRKAQRILVTGPNAADIQVLLGSFYRGVSANLCSVVEGITGAAPEGTLVVHFQGCYLQHDNIFPSTWTYGQAEMADMVVAVVGISPLMEGESGECIGSRDGGDRDDLGLPPNQIEFLKYMKKAGKPLVVIVTGGSPVALQEVHKLADAILFIWYPGEQGGNAVGDLLFGKESPSAKLPMTFPKSVKQLPPYENYALKGRTYRYMTKEPLYPFGFGLSYTTFRYSRLTLSSMSVPYGKSLWAEARVTNTGKLTADEIVQLYLSDDEASVPVPRWALKGFKRVTLKPGQSRIVKFRITRKMMEMVNDDGDPVLEPGAFTVTVGGASPGDRSVELGAPKPVTGRFEVMERV